MLFRSRAEIMEDLGITVQSIVRQLVGWASGGLKNEITQEAMRFHADENADRKPLH